MSARSSPRIWSLFLTFPQDQSLEHGQAWTSKTKLIRTDALGNLTIRTFMRRFTRLTLGFSKKLPNLRAAVALHVFHYNFCRIHGSLKMTPAMKAGVTDRLWSLEGFFG